MRILFLFAMLLAGPISAQVQLASDRADLRFRLTIPAEFEEGNSHEIIGRQKLGGYHTKSRIGSGAVDPTNGLPYSTDDPCGIIVFAMGKLLDEAGSEDDDFRPRPNSQLSFFNEQWNGTKVFGARNASGGQVELQVHVPLSPQAIGIMVFGSVAREGELRAWLLQILQSTQGEKGFRAADSSASYVVFGLMALVLFVGLGGMYVLKAKRARNSDPASFATESAPAMPYPTAQQAQPPPHAAESACATCGAPRKPGRKKCMNCGAEA